MELHRDYFPRSSVIIGSEEAGTQTSKSIRLCINENDNCAIVKKIFVGSATL